MTELTEDEIRRRFEIPDDAQVERTKYGWAFRLPPVAQEINLTITRTPGVYVNRPN